MGFEDFFEHRDNRKHPGYYQQNDHGHHQRQEFFARDVYHHKPPFYDQGHGSKPDIAYLLMKLRTNPKLRMLIVAGGIIILVVLIIVVIALLPLIIKLFDYISTVGIQGIYDQGVAFLDKLWKGSGK